ncbi:hypothetical protein EV426DRAFT_575578 [Tirmania nivea]|nr:hypothetical protein EV426DRAFT_575578 [Tirmania nivea]
MAPIGQINYLTDKSISQAVNILAQDIAKKVRSGAVIRDKAVKAIRKGHAAKYPDDPSPSTLGQLLPPLPTAPNSQPKRIRTPETIKGLQRKGVKGKQEYNWDEDEDEGEEADAEEPGKTLRGPKCIVGVGKGMGYLKPVLKGGKRIVGVGTKGIVRPQGTRSSKKVVNIKEDDDEEEEEEAPKNIRTRSGTRSVGGGTGMVRPQGTRTSKKVMNIEEDEEDEEEEVPKNIKTKSRKVKVGGGKGSVRPPGTQTSKKVVDNEEEEEAPTYIYMKTKSGTGSVRAGKGIVRPKGIRTSKKVMNIEDDDEEEEEAPTYIYTKTKSRTGSVGVGKGIVRPKWIRTSKKVVNAEDDNEEEEEAPKKNKTRTGNVSAGGGKEIVRPQVTRISKKVVNFEVDDEEEEEEEEEEEDEVPAYIKTKSRKGYVGGAKGIVGGLGSGKSKGMVKMSGVQITRVQQEKEDEEEKEEAAEEEGQEEVEVEEDVSSAGEIIESTDEVEQGAPTVKRTVRGSGGKGLGKVMQGPVKGAKRIVSVGTFTRKSMTKPEAKEKGKEISRKRGASCNLRDDTIKRQTVNTKKSSSRQLKSNGKGQASTSSPVSSAFQATINFPEELPSSNESSGSAGGRYRGMGSQGNSSSTIMQTQGSSQLSCEWGSSDINQARSSPPLSIELDVHDIDNRVNRPKKRLIGAKANSWRNRSFIQFEGIIKAVVYNAANRIERITFFEEPLLDADRTEYLLAKVWKEAEIECGVDEERTSKIDAYMSEVVVILRSIQSRIRSHLMYEAKRHIAKLYEFDQNCSSEYIRKRGWGHRFKATKGARFIHLNFFDGVKKLGNQDPIFISRISGPFICLIFATLRHAILIYESGVFEDGDYFNYTNSSVAFNRMLKQWEGLPTTLEQSPLKEEAESYSIDNNELDEYAKELAEDLKRAEQTHLIPYGYFEEGSPTVPDTEGEVDDILTMHAKNAIHSPASERYDFSREDVEDVERDSSDTDGAGSVAVEDEDEDEGNESEDHVGEDADLEDKENNDDESEDGDSEDGL